jgi:hypothetical protein
MSQTYKTLRFRLSVWSGLTLILALLLPGSSAAALSATSDQLPLYFLRSADCTGEVVEISGTIHMVNQSQADGSVIGQFNYQDVTGLGLTSGNIYRVSAVDHVRLQAPFPASILSVQSFRLISPGAESNLLVQVLYRITVNGNGEVTVAIDELNTQCT